MGCSSVRVWLGDKNSEKTSEKEYEKLVASGFDGNLLVEYTFLFSWAGIPSCMISDIGRIKEKVGKLK